MASAGGALPGLGRLPAPGCTPGTLVRRSRLARLQDQIGNGAAPEQNGTWTTEFFTFQLYHGKRKRNTAIPVFALFAQALSGGVVAGGRLRDRASKARHGREAPTVLRSRGQGCSELSLGNAQSDTGRVCC